MVNERLMLMGSWELSLVDDTPKADIRDKLDFFGHIFILDSPIAAHNLADADFQSKARYVGILRTKKDSLTIGGSSLVGWLGDDAGKGNVWEAARNGTNATLTQWMMIAVPSSIALGSQIGAVAGTLTQSYINITPRAMIDDLMQYFGTEYRINPNFTLDYGLAANLFKSTPTAIATRLGGGADLTITGVHATALDLEVDAEDYTTRVLLMGNGVLGSANNATTYKDGRGNTLAITRIVSDPLAATVAEANTRASTEIAKWDVLHQQVMLTTDMFDIGRAVTVGDWIYVYDPQRGLVDTSNQVRYRGLVLPLKVRVLSMTWPIERGLGIYYRDLNGVYTDLTPYVAYEQPGVDFEISAVRRKL